MCAANMKEGRPWPNSKNFDGNNISAQQAADMLHVTRPQVFHAKTVLAHGTSDQSKNFDFDRTTAVEAADMVHVSRPIVFGFGIKR